LNISINAHVPRVQDIPPAKISGEIDRMLEALNLVPKSMRPLGQVVFAL
jgi:hypothetical protein